MTACYLLKAEEGLPEGKPNSQKKGLGAEGRVFCTETEGVP